MLNFGEMVKGYKIRCILCQKSTYSILLRDIMSNHQKSVIILENTVFKKLKLSKNVDNKKNALNMMLFNEILFRKIQIILTYKIDLESQIFALVDNSAQRQLTKFDILFGAC